jgi:hypothetical protein
LRRQYLHRLRNADEVEKPIESFARCRSVSI